MVTPIMFTLELNMYYSESSSYPRLEIPQDLPRQSNANTSVATLHAYGVTHAITLDGTPDGKLTRCNIMYLILISDSGLPTQH